MLVGCRERGCSRGYEDPDPYGHGGKSSRLRSARLSRRGPVVGVERWEAMAMTEGKASKYLAYMLVSIDAGKG